MTSVASAAAQPPAIPDEGGIAAPGFLSLPSRLDGFVQTGEPREDVRTEEFGTSDKGCRRPARVLTVPGVLAAGDAPTCLCSLRCGRFEVVTFSWTSRPGGEPPYGEVQQGAA